MKLATIYALTEPDGEVRYIGKVNGAGEVAARYRMYMHKRWNENSHRAHWIQSLIRRGLEPGVAVICVVPHELWVTAERMFIEYYRQCGARLTNTTDGGDGASGSTAPKSPEHRAKLAAICRANAERRRGVPLKQEHIDRIWSKNKNRSRDTAGRFV
jgi:hypothetical protein